MLNIQLIWDGLIVPLFGNDEFECEKIENLTWGEAELATSDNPFRAGDILQNSRPMPRDVTITLKPLKDKGDYTSLLHKLCRMYNKNVRLVWFNRPIKSYTTAYGSTEQLPDITATCELAGIVNGIECPRFSDGVRIEINVHCSNPYWIGPQMSADLSGAALCLYSDVDPGFTIEIENLELHNTSNTYRLSVTFDDNKNGKTLFIKALSSVITDTLIITFSNYGVTIVDDTGQNLASKVRWTFSDDEFPNIPIRTRASYIGMMRSDTGAGNWTRVSGTLKWAPLLI